MSLLARLTKGCCLLAVVFAILLIVIMPDFFHILAELFLETTEP
jgi:hypothetical protein